MLFLLAIVLGVASVIGSEQSTIILETKAVTVAKADVFEIQVYAVATTPVNAVSLKIDFPSNTVEVLGIDKGESVLTLWTTEPKVDGNTVVLEGGTYRKGFIGKHLIATINVKATAAGQATFVTKEANLLAGDGRGSTVKTDTKSSGVRTLTIKDDTDNAELRGEVALVIITDVTGDGAVDFADITHFMTEWVARTATYDFNGDGAMSFRDFSILLAAYFKSR